MSTVFVQCGGAIYNEGNIVAKDFDFISNWSRNVRSSLICVLLCLAVILLMHLPHSHMFGSQGGGAADIGYKATAVFKNCNSYNNTAYTVSTDSVYVYLVRPA